MELMAWILSCLSHFLCGLKLSPQMKCDNQFNILIQGQYVFIILKTSWFYFVILAKAIFGFRIFNSTVVWPWVHDKIENFCWSRCYFFLELQSSVSLGIHFRHLHTPSAFCGRKVRENRHMFPGMFEECKSYGNEMIIYHRSSIMID